MYARQHEEHGKISSSINKVNTRAKMSGTKYIATRVNNITIFTIYYYLFKQWMFYFMAHNAIFWYTL